MQFLGAVRILGILIALFSSTLIPPIVVSILYADQAHTAFIAALVILLHGFGLLCWWPVRGYKQELQLREGFVVVVLIWVTLSIMAAVPLLLVDNPCDGGGRCLVRGDLGVDHHGGNHPVIARYPAPIGAVLSSATAMAGRHGYHRVWQWQSCLRWGSAACSLYRAETPGPMKDVRLTPRITETAKAVWYIYLGLDGSVRRGLLSRWHECVFDAVCHAFSTVSIGGFSTHDASLGYFQNNTVYLLACLFMILAGLNFALHFTAVRSLRVSVYLKDTEAKVYFGVMLMAVIVTIFMLTSHHTYDTLGQNLIQGTVQVISIVTTTGFTTAEFSLWPTFVPLLLILLSTAGGCAGSTAGGMKIVRITLLFKQGLREISRLVHPSALIPIKLGGKPVADNVINAVWGFLSLYIFSFTVLLILMLATGCDLTTAWTAVAASLNNLGPGLGDVAHNYKSISDSGKIILTFAMLLGRLELFTLLVLVSPVFWKG